MPRKSKIETTRIAAALNQLGFLSCRLSISARTSAHGEVVIPAFTREPSGAAESARAATNDDDTATIIVQNNNVRAVTVYAVTSDGKLKKLGWIGSSETRLFDVSSSLLQDDGKLQLKVFHPNRPEGGLSGSLLIENRGIKTNSFAVELGTAIGLWIDADLNASRVFLR